MAWRRSHQAGGRAWFGAEPPSREWGVVWGGARTWLQGVEGAQTWKQGPRCRGPELAMPPLPGGVGEEEGKGSLGRPRPLHDTQGRGRQDLVWPCSIPNPGSWTSTLCSVPTPKGKVALVFGDEAFAFRSPRHTGPAPHHPLVRDRWGGFSMQPPGGHPRVARPRRWDGGCASSAARPRCLLMPQGRKGLVGSQPRGRRLTFSDDDSNTAGQLGGLGNEGP